MIGLEAIEDQIEKLDRVIIASEDWAKIYSKNPESHAKLIKAEAKFGRQLRKYFRDFANKRLNNYINWAKYQRDAVKAYQFDVIVDVDQIDDEEDVLLNILHDPLQMMMALGATTAEETYNIDLGLNQYSDAIMKANSKYVADLVRGVNNTTKDRIKQSINQSLNLGEDLDAAISRLQGVINDPRRAELIARTESVRSYSKGTMVFGQESNADRMFWELSSNPCELCQAAYEDWGGADGIPFDIDKDPPPEHPNCRCGNSLAHNYDSEDDN